MHPFDLNPQAKFLGPQRKLGIPAYRLDDPFVANAEVKMVSLGFECLIEGFRGFGTDYVYLDNDNLIKSIKVDRYSSEKSYM